jgi:hypothetical protein
MKDNQIIIRTSTTGGLVEMPQHNIVFYHLLGIDRYIVRVVFHRKIKTQKLREYEFQFFFPTQIFFLHPVKNSTPYKMWAVKNLSR